MIWDILITSGEGSDPSPQQTIAKGLKVMFMPESEKRAREKWGKAWDLLSTEMQRMAINQEKYFLIMAEFRSAKMKDNPIVADILAAID